MLDKYSSEFVGVTAMIYLVVTVWIGIRCAVLCGKKVHRAWNEGFGPGVEYVRAAVGQDGDTVPWMASVVAAWLALLWGGVLSLAIAGLWPLVFLPIFAFAFFLPFYFKMAAGLAILTAVWLVRERIGAILPKRK